MIPLGDHWASIRFQEAMIGGKQWVEHTITQDGRQLIDSSEVCIMEVMECVGTVRGGYKAAIESRKLGS